MSTAFPLDEYSASLIKKEQNAQFRGTPQNVEYPPTQIPVRSTRQGIIHAQRDMETESKNDDDNDDDDDINSSDEEEENGEDSHGIESGEKSSHKTKVRIHTSITLDVAVNGNKRQMKGKIKFSPSELSYACGFNGIDPSFITIHSITPIHASGPRDMALPIYVSAKRTTRLSENETSERGKSWNMVYSLDKKKHYMAIISGDSNGAITTHSNKTTPRTFPRTTREPECIWFVAKSECPDSTLAPLLSPMSVTVNLGFDFLVEFKE
jgi:hypothetical protein